ncbi:hypothetical protein ACJ41O_007690 [Fusarium nematophilum]
MVTTAQLWATSAALGSEVGTDRASLPSFESTQSVISVTQISLDEKVHELKQDLRQNYDDIRSLLRAVQTPQGRSRLDSDATMKTLELRGDLIDLNKKQVKELAELSELKDEIKTAGYKAMPNEALGKQISTIIDAAWDRSQRIRRVMNAMEVLNNIDEDAEDQDNGALGGDAEGNGAGGDDVQGNHAPDNDVHNDASSPSPLEGLAFDSDLDEYDTLGDVISSRRVVINNLPQSVTLTQVYDGVTALGGVLSIQVLNTAALSTTGNCSAVIEFKRPAGAQAFYDYACKKSIYFEDDAGDLHRADVQLVKTASYPLTADQVRLSGINVNDSLSGRCLDLALFPGTALWYTMKRIGLGNIVRVNYTEQREGFNGELSIELISLFQAGRVRQMVHNKVLPGYPGGMDDIQNGLTPSDLPSASLWSRCGNVIACPDKDHLEKEWNRYPFNSFVPTKNIRFGSVIHRKRVPDFAPRKLYIDLNIIPLDDDDLPPLENLDGKFYVLDGRDIYSTRLDKTNQYCQVSEQDISLLMDVTLHKPEWKKFWDTFCDARSLGNLRAWDEYGKLAKHRREKAAEQGLEPGTVPDCSKCSCRSGDLKSSPVPKFIQDYTSFNTREVVDTEQGRAPST